MRHVKVTSVACGIPFYESSLLLVVLLLCLASLSAPAAASLATAYPFEEQLVPVGPVSPQEDHELGQAIDAYRARSAPDDVHALNAFITTHPHSAWSLALLTNIGLSDYHYGYFSRAIDDFQDAWDAGRTATTPSAKALADRALGELLRMHARLGHVPELTTLLAETQHRDLIGSANAMRDGAKDGLWLMNHRPGTSFLCGPMALKNLLHASGAPPARMEFLNFYRSSTHGVTLAEVGKLADQAQLPHMLIHRAVDEAVPVPSIVHWKVNHFAAIIGQEGDRFRLADPTFGENLWVTRAALNTESSGYFLVPSQKRGTVWHQVSDDEAEHVYGMGQTDGRKDNYVTPLSPCACNKAPPPKPGNPGLTGYDFKEMLTSLHLSDTPVGYTPPKGPSARVQLVYNQLEVHQPSNPSFSSVGPLWTFNFLSYVTDDPTTPGTNVTRFVGGGGESEPIYNGTTKTLEPDVQDASVLSLTATNPVSYSRTLRNGSSEIYSVSNGATAYPRLIFLSEMIDPAGNALHLNYDSMMRLISIVDATNRTTTFAYGLSGSPFLVTQITDPFKRSAKLAYDASGQLTDITDVIGMNSHFTYPSATSLQLTTPYGTTNFTFTSNGDQHILQATDPLGYTEHLEYYQGAPNIQSSDPANLVPNGIVAPFNAALNDRDTYYWDKHAYALAPNDYTRARQRHWAHDTNNISLTSDTLESEKYPLENRTWFNYPGQSTSGLGAGQSGTYEQPSVIARVMDDGTSKVTRLQYNNAGNVAGVTDPVGRQTQLVYAANQVDVTAVQQNTGSGFANVAQFPSYNSQHLPLSYVDAAGQTTKYSYYPGGLLNTVTDALGQKTTYIRNGLGDLTSVVDANNKTLLTLTYDNFSRVLTSTDSEGWMVQYAYDALDRVTTETYPDKTTRVFTYQYLDLYKVKDRQGRVTTYTHDSDQRLTSVQDPYGNLTKLGYAENGTPTSLTDPNGHTTTWNIDLESRVTSKIYADGHGTGYGYEAATSRLLYVADMLNQIKQYSYTLDDKQSRITFYNSVNPTPNVAFTYDPYFPRLTSMTDGSGTTQYQYNPMGALGALQLAQETPPFANATIAYGYDKLGRLSARSVGGDMEQFGYDTLNRLRTHVDDLGTFQRTYLGETTQLTGQSNGTLGTTWTYDTNTNDRRLIGIGTIGGTTYGLKSTDENDLINLTDSTNNLTWTYSYDTADRLSIASMSANLNYVYKYDAASNLTSIQRPKGTTTVPPNTVNQAMNVNGVASTYDANGNLLKDYARTYAWDANNRLIGVGIIGQSGLQTNFKYDGLDRRIAIYTTSGGITSETRYQWCGETLCQARSSIDTISRRYFAEGENAVVQGQSFYYGTDQLGSVRDALALPSGGVAAHYDYEPYGMQSNTALATTDFRYGGLFYISQIGLSLGTYRAYDSLTGRWIKRDPISETGGENLYRYVGSNPLTFTDPSGKCFGPLIIYCGYEVIVVGTAIVEAAVAIYTGYINPVSIAGEAASVLEGGICLAEDTTRVGRVMSQEELKAMQSTGMVQESYNGGVTSVTVPPDPTLYRAGPNGDTFVQFDVPSSSINAQGSGIGKIFGPNSIFGPRLNITSMPPATNITVP